MSSDVEPVEEALDPSAPEYTHQAHVAVREAVEVADDLATARVDPEETRETKTPGFSRMRVEWSPHDAPILDSLRIQVDGVIVRTFTDAYEIMNQVYDLVREAEVDEKTGEIATDRFGYKIWKRKATGEFIEDFSLLTLREREDLLFRITTRLFDWKQRQADMWGDAMFAKAQWEEAMAIGFDEPEGRLTVDARTQKGRLYSREQRYFAIFQSLISRRADAVVQSMEMLGLRLSQRLD